MSSGKIDVEFPEELLIAVREDSQTFPRKVKIYTLGHLYEEGKISSGIGAKILGCDRLEFYRLLSEYGFSVIDLDEQEWELEVQRSREIAARAISGSISNSLIDLEIN